MWSILLVSLLSLSTYAHTDSVAEPYVTWKNSSVRVCWGDAQHIEETGDKEILYDVLSTGITNWKYEKN